MIRFGYRLCRCVLVKHGLSQASAAPQMASTLPVARRLVYDMTNIGLDNFEFSRVLALNANKDTNKFEETKTKLKSIVENKSEVINHATFCDDLSFFMLLANKDEDIDLVADALRFYSSKVRYRDNKNFHNLGDRLMKLLYYLKKADKAIGLYYDQQLFPYFTAQTVSFYLMNRLFEDKRYSDVVDVFYKYVEYLNPKKIEAKRFDLKKQKQLIPFGTIKMASAALMMMNTRKSFEMIKDLIEVCEQHKSVLNNTALSCCFLLSIRQKEYQFAYELIFKFKWNYTLMHNLKAIALLKLNRYGEAYSYLELVSKVPQKPTTFDGKFFKFTVDCFEECIKSTSLNANELKLYRNLITQMKSKLYEKDLVDYCLS